MNTHLWRGALVIGCLMVAATAFGQAKIRCESQDGRYHECRYDGLGSIALTRQISGTRCVEGQTWGVRGNVIWVDDGCRAEFAVWQRGDRRTIRRRTTTVVCESQSGRREQCTADTRLGVALSRQLSREACVEGRSWGYTNNSIWVDNGCRAEFIVGGGRRGQGQQNPDWSSYAKTIVCESVNNRRNYCPADTIGGVELTRQISKTNCVLNRDWGYDSSGVWVTNGCRAEFRVGGRYESLPPYSQYSTTVTCESVNNRRIYCPADTRFGVQIGRQLSDNNCIFNRDWGYDNAGIWVRNGCRAEFFTNTGR